MFYESLVDGSGIENYHNAIPKQQYNYRILIPTHYKIDTALESFVVYELHVKIDDATYEVKRRFRDFDWLMVYLNNKYQDLILPPLPEKRYVSGTAKFDRKYIDNRMKCLEKMLNRLCIQECINDERFNMFLTCDTETFLRYKKDHRNKSSSNLSQNFQYLLSDRYVTFKLNQTVSNSSDQSRLVCFESLHRRLTDRIFLKSILGNIEKSKKSWSKFQQITLTLAQELADIFLKINESASNHSNLCCQELAPVIDRGAQIYFNWSSDSKSHVNITYEKLTPVFVEYLSYDEILIRKLRLSILKRKRFSIKEREQKKVNASIPDCQRDTLPKGNKLDQLNKELDTLQGDITHFDTVFYPSYTIWQQDRVRDISEALKSYTYNQISYHRSCLQMCKDFYQKINV